MPVDLPAPDRTILERAPLVQVVCQVRFDEVEGRNDRRTALRFFEKLGGVGGPFPKLTQAQAQQITVTAQMLPDETAVQQHQQRGWRFSNARGDCHITLLLGSLALETTAYRSWEAFAPHLERALGILAEEVEPALEQRLGLRFVNLILVDSVRDPADWVGLVAPDLLAPGLHPVLGSGVQAAQHRVVIDLADELRCLLNYGLALDVNGSGRTGYLLDIDVFRERAAPFSAVDVLEASESMNERAVSVFQQLTTSELRALLRDDGRQIGEGEA